MSLLFFTFKALLAGFAFWIGKVLTSPFPKLNKKWLQLTLPKMISFLEECLSFLDPNNEAHNHGYEMGHRALLIYKTRLSEVNNK